MNECFIEKRFSANSKKIIEQANSIISEYENQGYDLTLRQLYYQFVARDIIENTQKSYKNLGSIINDGRLAGLIDWESIEDRTRHVRYSGGECSDVKRLMMSAIKYGYNLDKWKDSSYYVEVWVEKDALISIVENVCRKYEIACLSCRGYVSQSEMYQSANRFIKKYGEDKECILLHLGDHDPSGIDMTRDITDRLNVVFKADVKVQRIALTEKQIDDYSPPPNFAKITDSRFKEYKKVHGEDSWELDALEPSVIEKVITKNVLHYVDLKQFEQIKKLQETDIMMYLEKVNRMKI